jgi:glutathione synthase/RimK-type ligase-like ATP-grasp enzyme
MILLCGIPSESPLRLVIEAAEKLGVPFLLFNQRRARFSDIHLEIKKGRVDGAIRIQGTDWPLRKFSGVYLRLMDYQDLPETRPHDRARMETRDIYSDAYKSQLFHRALTDWVEITECRVMNRPRAMSSNISKPYQAQFINQAGFRTPITLITNEPEEARNFLRLHRKVIYKSISSERSVVKMLNGYKVNELEKIRYLPTQFQAFVPGVNVRVHVVGETAFATEISTEAVDYRYASEEQIGMNMAPINLPSRILTRCLSLSQMLELPLCGIDLKRTPEGDYYCFEVNPSPAYSYYQENTGQDIATAIVKYLM